MNRPYIQLTLITFLFLTITNTVLAQIEISVNNPEPHVGQEFQIEFSSDFFTDYLKENLPADVSVGKTTDFLQGKIQRNIMAMKTGPMTLGPFKIRFNGKRFKTNSIIINVQPALEAKPGIWIRKITKNDKEYILIEQIVMIEPIKTFSSNSVGMTWQTQDDDFATLVEETDFDGIEFDAWGSATGQSPNKLIEWPTGLTYSYKFFRIEKSDDFKGPIKLDYKHFNNWPKDVELPELVVE